MDLDPTLLTWIFFVGGLLLLFLEVFIPGGVALFLGLGGILVAGLRAAGLLVDPMTAFIAWSLLSAGLTVALRPIALRLFGGESTIGITDEDAETMGQTVTVLEEIGEDKTGRVRFRGAAWDARTLEGTLPEGAEGRIVYRDNLTWVVEPTDHSDLDHEFGDALASDKVPIDTSSSDSTQNSDTTSSGDTDAEDTGQQTRSRQRS
ncbi:nodulation protein NfeD [Longibacter salinarum]|uniref:Nodulation protein NfeD n=1 Tax=Longibacter salinarum TaxID=1850348 RepID=A0A2A8CV21_9BACT|nr:NfeD family protein [Longibacter salinarum]PEN11391.1 nodulation protein NfeD [Longibacter salinarum]